MKTQKERKKVAPTVAKALKLDKDGYVTIDLSNAHLFSRNVQKGPRPIPNPTQQDRLDEIDRLLKDIEYLKTATNEGTRELLYEKQCIYANVNGLPQPERPVVQKLPPEWYEKP